MMHLQRARIGEVSRYKRMFGDTIYRLRKKKKLSLCELGKLLGTDSKVIYKWESHKECPSITLVPLLVQLLDDDEGDLFLYYYDFVIGG